MANITVIVPESLKKKMEQTRGVNWSEVAREAFKEAIRRKQMREAAESMDRLRESARADWSAHGSAVRSQDRGPRDYRTLMYSSCILGRHD